MKSELLYAQEKRRNRWIIFFVILGIILLIGMYKITDGIRTHSMPVGQIQLSIPYSKYLVGEDISFSIKNNYNSAIFFTNKCPEEPLNVYRLDGNKWVRVHDSAQLKDCSKENRQIIIPANGTVSGSFAPWKNLFKTPGKYRVVAYVEYYNALPFQDFEVINAPTQTTASTTAKGSSSTTLSGQATRSSSNPSTSPLPSPSPTQSPNPTPSPVQHQTYTLYVNSGGNYSPTSLVINVGDSIKLIYSPPTGDEVRTRFSPATISTVTLDSEFKTRTITINSTGTWTFKADDHSGNTGTLKVI